MAMYGVGGKIGGGKTYFCCDHLVRKFFTWDKIHSEYMRRFPVEIITNIEDLKLDHFKLDEMILKSGKGASDGTVETFFTIDYQRKLLARFPRLVYFIDEAGKYFPAGFKDKDVLFFFQYHRHLGIDLYLVSASLENISRGILGLLEYRIIAKERSRRVLNEFRYHKYVGSDKVGTVILKPDHRLFALYRSMDSSEHEKIPSVTRRILLFAICFVVVGFLLFRYTIANFGQGNVKRIARASDPGPGLSDSPSRFTAPGSLTSGNSDPLLKSGGVPGVQSQARDRGVPLAERGVKGGATAFVSIPSQNVSLDDLGRGYVRVFLTNDLNGNPVCYSGDGRFYAISDFPVLLRDSVRVGASLYVKRVTLPSVPARKGTGETSSEVVPKAGSDPGVTRVSGVH